MINKSKSIRFLLLFSGMMAICMVGNLPAEEGDQENDWHQLGQLDPNTVLRVVLNDARQIQGEWLSADEASLTLSVGDTPNSFNRDDVRRVYQLKRGSRARHALIGVGVGAGGGLATGAIVDAGQKESSWFPHMGKQIFTPLGAIVGAIVGVVWPTRENSEEIYRAPSLTNNE